MTISAYVLVLLLILSFISRNHLSEKRAFLLTNTAYLQCKERERALRNEREIEKYRLQVKTNKSPTVSKKPLSSQKYKKKHSLRIEKELATYKTKRKARRASMRSQLNLAALTSASILRPITTRLIVSLYEGTSLFKSSPEYLRALAPQITTALLNSSSDSLTGRLAQLRKAHPILYKMLRGTSFYYLENKQGYPPLSDFFTIDANQSKAVYFHYASIPLLDALFGKRIRCIISALEKKKWEEFYSYDLVKRDEAFAILRKEKKDREYDILEPLITFSR